MTEKTVVRIKDIDIDVIKKDIKNIHLSVYPPNAEVRISAPESYDIDTIRHFAISKLSWIKDNIEIIQKQKRIEPKDYVSGESHYLFGRRYRFKLVNDKKSRIEIQGTNTIVMYAKEGVTRDYKHKLMNKWYKTKLEDKLNTLIKRWENITGFKFNSWQIKKMKSRWGSCNPENKTAIFNPELSKTKIKNIEYIILHELIHTEIRTHNKDFLGYLNKYMPNWTLYKNDINSVTFE